MRPSARFVDLTQRIIYLRSIPVAAMLSPSVLRAIAGYLRERTFAAGEVLMREGEPISALHLLTEGKLSLVRKGNPFGELAPPQSLGFLGILARGEGTYDAKAEVDTRSLELDAETLIELLEDHFELLHSTLRYLAERLLYEIMELPAEALGRRLEGDQPEFGARDLDLVERILYLRSLPIFSTTNLNALAALSQQLVQQRIEPGTVLWRKGEPSDWSCYVLQGSALCVGADGHTPSGGVQHPKQWRAGPRSTIGGIEAIAGIPRWYDLSAESPLLIFKHPLDGFIDLLEDDFGMAMEFVKRFATDMVGILERKAAAGQSTVGVMRNVSKLGAVPVGA